MNYKLGSCNFPLYSVAPIYSLRMKWEEYLTRTLLPTKAFGLCRHYISPTNNFKAIF